ncbi:DUF1129 domain-containing protein [Acinetobacter baumannii]|uniref:DUF1129 domain-containing protein n=1 Tax=Acinetobacter baumannii TaxID=470 RepID=UPI0021BDD54B|nr:DUF1129 domain-containing protein [Acinetobacter baumannii]MDV7443576.1 DUF1129 domain-containing protein [Acinetobacter baumannii]
MSEAQSNRAQEILNHRENELLEAKRKYEQLQTALDEAKNELDAAQKAFDNQARSDLL